MFLTDCKKIIHWSAFFLIVVRNQGFIINRPMGRKRERDLTAFGEYLEKIKGDLTWGQIKQRLEFLELGKLTSGQFSQDKTGRNLSIPKGRLQLYANLFDAPYPEIVRAWVAWRYGEEAVKGDFQSAKLFYFDPRFLDIHHQLELILLDPSDRRDAVIDLINKTGERIESLKKAQLA